MACGNSHTQVAILCILTLYPQVAWASLASSRLAAMSFNAPHVVNANDQAQSLVAPVQMLPAGAAFPSAWTLTRVMNPTMQWGLTLDVFQLQAPLPSVQRWLPQIAANCTALTQDTELENAGPGRASSADKRFGTQGFDATFSLPETSPQLLWMCADTTQLYSLLRWQGDLLWTISARHAHYQTQFRGPFARFLNEHGALELQTTSTAFEQVSVYQISRTLVALQADIELFQRRYGLQVNEHQRITNGFLSTWQEGAERHHVSAIRQPDGRVIITHVTGTNL